MERLKIITLLMVLMLACGGTNTSTEVVRYVSIDCSQLRTVKDPGSGEIVTIGVCQRIAVYDNGDSDLVTKEYCQEWLGKQAARGKVIKCL